MKAAVSHTDISQVKIGQAVQIRIESCPYPDYGVAQGKVSAIAPDAKQPNSNSISNFNSSGNVPAVYDVTIPLQDLILQTSERSCTLKAGMQGRADIVAQQETILTFILRKMRLLVDI
jgi:HlyD family secretion protein